MQTLSCYKESTIRCGMSGGELPVYRCRPVQSNRSAGLPPRQRRRRRCPWGVGMSDLVSMSMVAMTVAATGMLVAVM